MHAGARIVDVISDDGDQWSIQVVARFEEHKSMNYGSDFIRESRGDGGLRIVSTSFYDRLLCIWSYRPNFE